MYSGLSPVLLALTVAVGASATPPSADIGVLAHAYPIGEIKIDGRLQDWPAGLKRYSLRHRAMGNERTDATDCYATYRVAYRLEDKSLYVAVEVEDQSHVAPSEETEAWTLFDSHTLYVDPTHSPRGSGAWLFTAMGQHRKLIGLERSWDSKVAKASWDNAEVRVHRAGTTTSYEYRIGLGDALVPGRTIGLDHLLNDRDADDTGDNSTLMVWGISGGKSRGASRIGDLVLVDPAAKTGLLRGKIGWADAQSMDFPRRVRVTSALRPEYWVHVQAAEGSGDFELELPAGRYVLSSPYKAMDDDEFTHTLDTSVRVEVEVPAGKVVRADKIALRIVKKPDLLEESGVLFDYDKSAEARVDAFVEAMMAHYRVPGVSLALIKDGKIAMTRAYGVKNFYTQEKVTNETLFEAASITKIVFAFAVNRLAERGEIDLDRPLHEYLPFPAMEYDKRYRRITARHVLTHQTGFPNWAYNNADGKLDIKFMPGTRFGYSGEGFEYLKRVVVHIKKKPIEAILLEEVQRPMGFVDETFFSDCEALRSVVAHGHWTTRTSAAYIPQSCGVAHSMHTNARALGKFMESLIAGKGLSKAGYQKMLATEITMPPPHSERPRLDWQGAYGLGFHLLASPFGLVYGHGGSNGDFKCRFEVYRDHDMGFVVFTNGSEGELFFEELRKYLILGKRGLAGVQAAASRR